jgi:hypothetical protein
MPMTLMGVYLRVRVVKAVLRRFCRGETMQAAAHLNIVNSTVAPVNSSSVTGTIGTLIARVFGCRHAELSRPFSRDGRAYRSCLNCGAQRQFNLGKWQMTGGFYYGQPQTHPEKSVLSVFPVHG